MRIPRGGRGMLSSGEGREGLSSKELQEVGVEMGAEPEERVWVWTEASQMPCQGVQTLKVLAGSQ